MKLNNTNVTCLKIMLIGSKSREYKKYLECIRREEIELLMASPLHRNQYLIVKRLVQRNYCFHLRCKKPYFHPRESRILVSLLRWFFLVVSRLDMMYKKDLVWLFSRISIISSMCISRVISSQAVLLLTNIQKQYL